MLSKWCHNGPKFDHKPQISISLLLVPLPIKNNTFQGRRPPFSHQELSKNQQKNPSLKRHRTKHPKFKFVLKKSPKWRSGEVGSSRREPVNGDLFLSWMHLGTIYNLGSRKNLHGVPPEVNLGAKICVLFFLFGRF